MASESWVTLEWMYWNLDFKMKHKDIKKMKTNIFFYLILLTLAHVKLLSHIAPGSRIFKVRAGMKLVPSLESLQ